MPVEERTVRGAERCANHPARATVAVCDVCGRPLCIECAIPVRGRVLGAECLPEVLGDDGLPPTAAAPIRTRPRRRGLDLLAGTLLAFAALATLLPWTRFSTGSGFAGAWATDRRWSMLAAGAAVVGIAWWWGSSRWPVLARGAAVVTGALVTAGAVLAALNPPPFTKPALAPWIAALAGAGTVVSAGLALARRLTPRV